MPRYLKESVEFQEISVQADGNTHDNFEISVVPYGHRPGTWTNPDILNGKPGIMIDGFEVGDYGVYVRVQSAPETPVIFAGMFTIR